MKVIIRDLEMGLYLSGPTSWGLTQSEAMPFENSIGALEFCVAQKLQNVELLLLIGDPRMDTPMRLFPRPAVGAGVPPFWKAQAPSTAEA